MSKVDIRKAFRILRSVEGCQLLERESTPKNGVFTFRMSVQIPQPNPIALSNEVVLKGRVPECYPYGEIEFFPEGDAVNGFPHQQAETGKLCLPPQSQAPLDNTRLATCAKWAGEWLCDAANDRLVAAGDPYELPDFSYRAVYEVTKTPLPVFLDEDAAAYRIWEGASEAFGSCEMMNTGKALVPKRFTSASDDTIRETAFSGGTFDGSHLRVAWLRLPVLIYERHRPPRTYGELREMCGRANISLRKVLRNAWNLCDRHSEYGMLLVGSPIPKVFGGDAVEMHWQPIYFRSPRRLRRVLKSNLNKDALWNSAFVDKEFGPKRPIGWGACENMSHNRLVARGALPQDLIDLNVAVVGVGALGGAIADMLFRGGVKSMSVLDSDTVEYGNLCRHELDGRDVGDKKAIALAKRLQSCNPISAVRGYVCKIPRGLSGKPEAWRALESADVIIDCSTDNSAFEWLSKFAKKRKQKVVSAFINPHATMITLLFSGKHTACAVVQKQLMADIAKGNTPLDSDKYFETNDTSDLIVPGTGCWHATFPATRVDLQLVSAAAAKHISGWCKDNYASRGAGLILQRNEVDSSSLVDTIWQGRYR